MIAACHIRNSYRRMATALDEAEMDLNEGFAQDPPVCTGTSSTVTGDPMDNEHHCLHPRDDPERG